MKRFFLYFFLLLSLCGVVQTWAATAEQLKAFVSEDDFGGDKANFVAHCPSGFGDNIAGAISAAKTSYTFSTLSGDEQGVYGVDAEAAKAAFMAAGAGLDFGHAARDASLTTAHKRQVWTLFTGSERSLLFAAGATRDTYGVPVGIDRTKNRAEILGVIAIARYGVIASKADDAQIALVLGEADATATGTNTQKTAFATKLGLQDNREVTAAGITAAIKTAWEAAVVACVTPLQRAIFAEALEAVTPEHVMPLLGGDDDLPVTTTRAQLLDGDAGLGIIGTAAVAELEKERDADANGDKTLFARAVKMATSTGEPKLDVDLAPICLGQTGSGLYKLLVRFATGEKLWTEYLDEFRSKPHPLSELDGYPETTLAAGWPDGEGGRYRWVTVKLWKSFRGGAINAGIFDLIIPDGGINEFYAWVKANLPGVKDITARPDIGLAQEPFGSFKTKVLEAASA